MTQGKKSIEKNASSILPARNTRLHFLNRHRRQFYPLLDQSKRRFAADFLQRASEITGLPTLLILITGF